MDPEQQKPWDAWVESHIRCALANNFREVLKPAIAQALSEYVYARLTRETKKLREEFASEIGSLREQRTRDKLAREWSTFPASDKMKCIRSIQWFQPTYTELASCLELARDAKRLGGEKATNQMMLR